MTRLSLFLLLGSLLISAKEPIPPLPWTKIQEEKLPPGVPFKDYTPAVTTNGSKAEYKIVDGVKVFHLTAEPIEWEVASGFKLHTWAYNGSVPGPMIEVTEGDNVRIYMTNKLSAPTTTHWHGILIPCGIDGVGGVTQFPIPPGETYLYEYTFSNSWTFMMTSENTTSLVLVDESSRI